MLSARQAHGITRPVSVVADTPALAFRRVFFKNMPDTKGDAKLSIEDGANEFLDPPGTQTVKRQVATPVS
jgi:hypothetical protein